jgi:hypothetical protein
LLIDVARIDPHVGQLRLERMPRGQVADEHEAARPPQA